MRRRAFGAAPPARSASTKSSAKGPRARAAHAHATVRFARSDSGLGSDDVSSARDIGYRVPKSLAVGRPRTAAASVFFVGRAVEQMVSRSEGDRDARHWLEVCARREESAWVDLGSVAGCRRVDLFRRVRQAGRKFGWSGKGRYPVHARFGRIHQKIAGG